MGFFKKSVGTLVALGALGVSGNAGINHLMDKGVTEEVAVKQVLHFKDDPRVQGTLEFEEFTDKYDKTINIYSDFTEKFWDHGPKVMDVYEAAKKVQKYLKFDDVRSLDIALALDVGSGSYQDDEKRRDTYNFKRELKQANSNLAAYGVRLNLADVEVLCIRGSHSEKGLADAVKNSFDDMHDYYFNLSESDFSGHKDWSLKAMTDKRVAFMDSGFNDSDVDKVLYQETLRLLAGVHKTTEVETDFDKYYTELDFDEVMKRRFDEFKDKPFDVKKNLNRVTKVSINIGLDDVTEEYAREAMEKVKQEYMEEFNIELIVHGYYQHRLPKSWDMPKEVKKLKKITQDSSHINIIMTNTDWKDSDSDPAGTAYPGNHYTWMEMNSGDIDLDAMIIEHEIGHLFHADHDYRKNSIMHPQSGSRDLMTWTPIAKHDILKHKFQYERR